MRPDFKTARQQLTGGMPTGEHRMADMEFMVTHNICDGLLAEQRDSAKQAEDRTNLYFTSLDDALRWCEEQQ